MREAAAERVNEPRIVTLADEVASMACSRLLAGAEWVGVVPERVDEWKLPGARSVSRGERVEERDRLMC